MTASSSIPPNANGSCTVAASTSTVGSVQPSAGVSSSRPPRPHPPMTTSLASPSAAGKGRVEAEGPGERRRGANGEEDGVVDVDVDEGHDPLLPHLVAIPPCPPPSSSSSNHDATCTDATTATDVRTSLLTEGYCVIRSVLTQEECTSSLSDLWDYVEVTSGGRVRRDDPTTYYPRPRDGHRDGDGDATARDGTDDDDDDDDDPWPYSGWGSFPDMFQTNGAGWVNNRLREVLATRVFDPLVFGTERLQCSKEGFTFHRPRRYRRRRRMRRRVRGEESQSAPSSSDENDEEGGGEEDSDSWEWVTDCHPAYGDSSSPSSSSDCDDDDGGRRGRTFRVCGKDQHNVVGEHFDQSSSCRGLCHVHSVTSFVDQNPAEGGCFLCWPRSHAFHQRLTEGTYRGKFPWVPLTDDDLDLLRDEGGLSPLRVPVGAGDVILWRSDLVHAAITPSRRATGFRAVAYVSMMPAELTEKSVLRQRLRGYRQIRTGDHRAEIEFWHDEGGGRRRGRRSTNKNNEKGAANGGGGESSAIDEAVVGGNRGIVSYFRYGPPLLTWRQAELYGLVPFGTTPEDRPDAIRRALVRGVRFLPEVEAEALPSAAVEPTKSNYGELGRSSVVRPMPPPPHLSSRPPIRPPEARLTILSPSSPPLLGQDKWLGGVPSPCGRYVYGVPGTARRVLRITVSTGAVDLIGPHFPGKFKWLRGIDVPPDVLGGRDRYPCGLVLCLPSNADCVLKVDPSTQEVTTFGGPLEGDWLYHGGVISPHNGMVYAIPANAGRVLKIDPRTDDVTEIGPIFDGRQKWYGGILARHSGAIYGIPQNANGVLKIMPRTDEVTVIGEGTLPGGLWQWHGGTTGDVDGDDGDGEGRVIYGFPNNADTVLRIDTTTDEITLLGGPDVIRSGRHRIPQDGKYKYLGGAVSSTDGNLYLFPCDAERVLRVDTRTDEVECVGPVLLEGENKYQNGFSARDGAVYAIPQRARGVLVVSPNRGEPDVGEGSSVVVDVIPCDGDGDAADEGMAGCKDKFEGGVLGSDGSIYCIPLRAKRVVKVIPGPAI